MESFVAAGNSKLPLKERIVGASEGDDSGRSSLNSSALRGNLCMHAQWKELRRWMRGPGGNDDVEGY